MKQNALMFMLLYMFSAPLVSGQGGFSMVHNGKQVEIPFEFVNNFIIISLKFNNGLPLKFIFDTGAEHTILTKREVAEFMRVHYDREFRIMGSDMKTELTAYLARRVRFELTDKAIAPHEDILVLEEDYFRFEEYAGVSVHGILAASAFAQYIIKINYQRRVMTLYDRDEFSVRDQGYVELPLEIYHNKPYINTLLTIEKDSSLPVKLLLDTGAGLPLMLFSNTHPLLRPPKNSIVGNIGMGLGGYLEGYYGRVKQLDLGPFFQKGIVAQFQQLDSVINYELLNHRNGLIGNVILSRFTVIFDLQAEKVWLKPIKNYQKGFEYDRSGINIIASGMTLSTMHIQYVTPGSPAAEIGLQKGDRLLRVGHWPASILSMSDITEMLQGKPDKKLTIVVKRDGKRIKKKIVLRDLL